MRIVIITRCTNSARHVGARFFVFSVLALGAVYAATALVADLRRHTF